MSCQLNDGTGIFETAQIWPRSITAFQMIPDGLEPSLPGCEPGVFAVGPQDLELQSVVSNGGANEELHPRFIPPHNAPISRGGT
jgi:hypothetical protein